MLLGELRKGIDLQLPSTPIVSFLCTTEAKAVFIPQPAVTSKGFSHNDITLISSFILVHVLCLLPLHSFMHSQRSVFIMACFPASAVSERRYAL